MKTNFFFFLKRSCYLFLFVIALSARGQQKTPKNHTGISAIGELNRLAVGIGVDYERWLFTKNQFAVGAKAHYIFPSKTINPIFSTNDALQRNSQVQLMATSYFFTNTEKEVRGFFFSFGAGINFIKWDIESYDASGNSYMRTVWERAPGYDISIGGYFKANRMAVRGGYQAFPADKYKEFVNGNGISLLYIKVSIAF